MFHNTKRNENANIISIKLKIYNILHYKHSRSEKKIVVIDGFYSNNLYITTRCTKRRYV